ncbi:MAG: 50S ribosomal protein L18Ae [Euryarchaeota archaeon]|nr:50S ribosomal protein L18Ae [Euryarchaeota archaeon]
MKKFEVQGEFKMGDAMQRFTKVFEAQSEKRARERTYCDIGSRHRVKRHNIEIHSIEEMKDE